MQKTNQAYAANDLRALLELQLQIDQIDAGHIASASAERLKHYKGAGRATGGTESRERERRVEVLLRPRARARGTPPSTRASWANCSRNTAGSSAELSQQQRELRMLADTAATQRWLKPQQRRLLREPAYGSFLLRGKAGPATGQQSATRSRTDTR